MSDKQKVYGKDLYADITYLCASALHAGVIQMNGGKFNL